MALQNDYMIMRLILRVILTILTVVMPNVIIAQLDLKVNKLTYKDGLRSETVLGIKEDQNGYIWMGTNYGLYRYDFQNFKLFHPDPYDPNYLPRRYYCFLTFSPLRNQMLLATGAGVSFLETSKYQFKKVIQTPTQKSIKYDVKYGNTINDSLYILLDCCHDKNSFQLFKIIAGTDSVSTYKIPLIADGNPLNLHEYRRYYFFKHPKDQDLAVFFADKFIYTINIHSDEITKVFTIDVHKNKYEGSDQIVTALPLNDGRYLMSIVDYGLVIYDIEKNTIQKVFDELSTDENIYTLAPSTLGKYWLGTSQGGLFLFDMGDLSATRVTIKDYKLDNQHIKCILETSNNNLFISANDGVLHADLSVNPFQNIDNNPRGHIKKNIVYNSGILHATLPIYIYEVYGLNNLWYVNLSDKKHYPLTSGLDRSELHIFFTHYGSESVLFVSNNEVYIISGKDLNYHKLSLKMLDNYIQTDHKVIDFLHGDPQNNIVIAGSDWLYIKSNEGKEYIVEHNFVERVSAAIVNDKMAYFSTNKKIYTYKFDTQELTCLEFDESSIQSFEITSFLKWRTRFFISTGNHGVFEVAFSENKVGLKQIVNPMLDNESVFIYAGTIDSDSLIWYSTKKGLLYLNPKNSTSMFYAYPFNFQSLEQYNPFYCNKSSICVSLSVSYIDWTFKDKILPPKIKPIIQLSAFLVNDMEVLTEVSENYEIPPLRYKENNIEVYWTYLKNLHPDFYLHSYQLKGFDNEWQVVNEDFNARYTNLSPGKYEFVIQSSLRTDPTITENAVISFEIRPPYWQTWWFILACSLLLAYLIYFYLNLKYKAAIQEAKVQTEYQRQLIDLKLVSLRAQMNPHFMFNSLNSIKNYILKNEREIAAKYLSKFAYLIRSVLNYSEEKYIPLSAEIQMVETYINLEKLRFNKEVTFTINVDPSLNQHDIMVQPLLIQPFLENAIWHGLMPKEGDLFLSLQISKSKNQIIYEITDNGVGRHKVNSSKSSSNNKKSYGVKITASRMKSIDPSSFIKFTDLVDHTGNAAGTKVQIGFALIENPAQITEF